MGEFHRCQSCLSAYDSSLDLVEKTGTCERQEQLGPGGRFDQGEPAGTGLGQDHRGPAIVAADFDHVLRRPDDPVIEGLSLGGAQKHVTLTGGPPGGLKAFGFHRPYRGLNRNEARATELNKT